MTAEPLWRKSTFSSSGNACVELADLGGDVGVRDSKLGDASPVLRFNRAELSAFLSAVKAGEFDDLAALHDAL